MAMPKVLNAVPNSVNKVAREAGSLRNAAREAASYKPGIFQFVASYKSRD
jgi:hypothetical protein